MKKHCLGFAVVVTALAGCPADDGGSGETGASMTNNVTMSSTMTTMDATDTAETMDTEAESSSGMVECPDDSLSYAADIQPIFDEHCITACHVTGGEWPSLLLEDAYDIIVDEDSLQTMTVDELVLIAPGDVANSYILHKLRGTQGDVVDPALALLTMPSEIVMCDMTDPDCRMDGTKIVEGTPLPDDLIQTIEDWVICGAPE